jgi:hypothetical protein
MNEKIPFGLYGSRPQNGSEKRKERVMNSTKAVEDPGAVYGGRLKGESDMREQDGTDSNAGGPEAFVKNAVWTMVVVTLIALVLLILWLGPPARRETQEEHWKQEFAEAERARESGDRYRALDMYIHSARVAASIDDWRGQLAIACGLQKLGKTEGPSLHGFNVIVSAMGAAERQKSAEGMTAVADAFVSLGASYASFALAQIRDDWKTDPSVANRRTFDLAAVQAPGC